MPRADEHEGTLNDTETKRAADRMNSRARKILSHDLADLTENTAFLRWFGKYATPVLTQDFPVNNGSALAEFMGRRQLVLQVIEEMDAESPGFLKRVLIVREEYEKDLRHAAQGSSDGN